MSPLQTPPTFTPSILHSIRSILHPPSLLPLSSLPPHTLPPIPALAPASKPTLSSTSASVPFPSLISTSKSTRLSGNQSLTDGQSTQKVAESAVLIPLLNVDGVAHVLLEVRATKMRTHAGEASFPGGKVDSTDANLVQTALRETFEELALPPEQVEILGMLDAPEYSLGNRSRVWAMVGFIHPSPFSSKTSLPSSSSSSPSSSSIFAPLPSLPLTTLIPSPTEVSALLPLPLSYLTSTSRRSTHYFRLDASRPYWKIRAGDLARHDVDSRVANDIIQVPRELEIWGLSGWFLNRLGVKLGWMDEPPVYVAEGD